MYFTLFGDQLINSIKRPKLCALSDRQNRGSSVLTTIMTRIQMEGDWKMKNGKECHSHCN